MSKKHILTKQLQTQSRKASWNINTFLLHSSKPILVTIHIILIHSHKTASNKISQRFMSD